MTWRHMEFVLIFSPADGLAKLGRMAAKRLLTLASLFLSYEIENFFSKLPTYVRVVHK